MFDWDTFCFFSPHIQAHTVMYAYLVRALILWCYRYSYSILSPRHLLYTFSNRWACRVSFDLVLLFFVAHRRHSHCDWFQIKPVNCAVKAFSISSFVFAAGLPLLYCSNQSLYFGGIVHSTIVQKSLLLPLLCATNWITILNEITLWFVCFNFTYGFSR